MIQINSFNELYASITCLVNSIAIKKVSSCLNYGQITIKY